jgi:hypothetical protein
MAMNGAISTALRVPSAAYRTPYEKARPEEGGAEKKNGPESIDKNAF